MALSVIILAAGQGTRMKSTTPKVLHNISGKPMLFYAIDAAQSLSSDITVVLNYQAERIQQEIETDYQDIQFHRQDTANYPGTGGALMGVNIKHTHALILNGDMPLVTAASLQELTEGNSDIKMSVIAMENPSGYGRVVIDNGHVDKIVEEKDCTSTQKKIATVNAGIYCVSKELLERYIPRLNNDNAQAEYYLTDIIGMATGEQKQVDPVFVQEEKFKGVNSKLDLANAEVIMQQHFKEKLMRSGIAMRLPETIFIDSRATFEGECFIENGVTILGHSHITTSTIKAHSVIEDATLIECSVGPMARIRPQSTLKQTHIGNFVEVKKSHLNGVKAGHLSYIGDCDIDKGSNIGAGTITCNYDGKAKHRTVIGKNVFVGSDTQLVAPVTLEDNTMIAAGSTITQDVPEGALAVARAPKQRLIQGFFYKFFGQEK